LNEDGCDVFMDHGKEHGVWSDGIIAPGTLVHVRVGKIDLLGFSL
jgi:hypothetical protein